MTYTVSGGALNSAQPQPNTQCFSSISVRDACEGVTATVATYCSCLLGMQMTA